MPFVKRSQITNRKLKDVGRKLIYFHYLRWQHSRLPLLFPVHSDNKYQEGLNSKYLSRSSVFDIRRTLTEAVEKKGNAFSAILNVLKTKHSRAYAKSYRKYFLKYMNIIQVFEIPLLTDKEKAQFGKLAKQKSDPTGPGREVPKGLPKL